MAAMRVTDIVRHRRERTRRADNRTHHLLRLTAAVLLLGLLMLTLIPIGGIVAGAAGLLIFLRDLPDVNALQQLPARFQPANTSTRLYAWDAPDEDGLRQPVLIDEITDPRMDSAGWVHLEDLPPFVARAHLALVDPQFVTATPPTIASALNELGQTGVIMNTHSPIVRNLIQTYLRDGAAAGSDDPRHALQDWFLGWQISRDYSPEQVLEWWLNTRYYGNLAYGIEAAARVYFGKGATDLSPGEAAMLAAIVQNPEANPFDDLAAARNGQTATLEEMDALGLITAQESAAAFDKPIALAPPPGSASPTPEFARLSRHELETILGPERLLAGGWQVETTVDLPLQAQVVCAATTHAARLTVRPVVPSGGGPPCPADDYLPAAAEPPFSESMDITVVALNPTTSEIEALFGDSAGSSPRPIGTLARPLIYLTALSQGYTAATQTLDVQSVYLQAGQPYTPRNADGDYLGPMRLREALVADRAATAAQTLSWVGVDRVLATAKALGLRTDNSEYRTDLSFADNGFPTTLLDLSQAFATIDNGGTAVGVASAAGFPHPTTVRRILDARGSEVYAYEPDTRQTLAPELAYLLTDMLADSDTRCSTLGCPNSLELPDDGRAAVATGESAAGDAWTIGYTPARLIGVWANGGSPTSRAATGRTDAAPLWRALMAWSTAGLPAATWPRPLGLNQVEVCEISGILPSREADCPTVREWFASGTEPSAVDSMVREVVVNRETGRLATIFTPPQLLERRSTIVYPPEATAWAAGAGVAAPPTEYDTVRHVPTHVGSAEITSPEPFARLTGQWSVVGSAGGEDFAYYQLAYFPGLLPEAMQTLIERAETPVAAAEIGVWDTTLLDDGLYTLLLTVIRQDGTFDEVAIPVTVENGESR